MLIVQEDDPNLEQMGWDGGYNATFNYKGKPFTGIIKEFEDDGETLALEIEYKDGYWDGLYKIYYPSGILKSEGKSYGPMVYDG